MLKLQFKIVRFNIFFISDCVSNLHGEGGFHYSLGACRKPVSNAENY